MSKSIGSMKLGTAKIDITPVSATTLAGFSSRSGVFNQVSQPLYARFFWLENTDSSSSVLVVSADLIGWGTDRISIIRKQLKERLGLEESSIIMNATHTHSGPQTSGVLSKIIGVPSIEYLESLEEKVLEGAISAAANAEPVRMNRGSGSCSININRRKLVDGLVTSSPNESGPVDREVTVISFTRDDGSIKGAWVHYACHPTISNLNEVSSEFCGFAMDKLEAELGDGAICGYLQSCCGDVRPNLAKEGKFVYGDGSDVIRLGEQLLSVVRDVLNRPMQSLTTDGFRTRHMSVPLKLQPLPSDEDLRSWRDYDDIMGEWSGLMLDNPDRFRAPVFLDIVYIQLAEGLSLLAMNGEVVMEYGLHIKSVTGGQVLPLGYSNGLIGYVPTARQIHEGGYEGASSFRYFGIPGPFDRSIEQDIHNAIASLLEK